VKKVNIEKALEFLKKYLNELEGLKNLKYDNLEWLKWKSRVNVVSQATFGSDSREYKEFNVTHRRMQTSVGKEQREYLEDLNGHELGITNILQKYEILGIPSSPEVKAIKSEADSPKAFIAHGGESEALSKLSEFLIALGIDPLVAEHQASKDMALDSKVEHYLEQADCAIILATGDDEINSKLYPRQNVSHEIGLAQKTILDKIVYLLEEDATFSSNISPKVWQRFTKEIMDQAFIAVARELKAFGIIKAVKPQ